MSRRSDRAGGRGERLRSLPRRYLLRCLSMSALRPAEEARRWRCRPAPLVTVSRPLQREVDTRAGFLGQFSAVDRVELRAQVGGTLTEIHFKDGQIVHKGDLLFVIDPRPYEIKLAQAQAALESANARAGLAGNQLYRAQSLKRKEFATQETV